MREACAVKHVGITNRGGGENVPSIPGTWATHYLARGPWGWVTHMCICKLGHHGFRQWLVTYLMPIHYLILVWLNINWTFKDKLQWNFHEIQNMMIGFSFQKMRLKIWTIKWWPFGLCLGVLCLSPWTLCFLLQMFNFLTSLWIVSWPFPRLEPTGKSNI